MALREQAGGDEDLFTVERKMRKQQRKMEIQRQKQYEKEKQRKDHNVFNFINVTLNDKRDGKYFFIITSLFYYLKSSLTMKIYFFSSR